MVPPMVSTACSICTVSAARSPIVCTPNSFQRIRVERQFQQTLLIPEHLALAERFSLLILEGYTARNPIAIDHWRSFRSRVEELSENNSPRPRVRSAARCS